MIYWKQHDKIICHFFIISPVCIITRPIGSVQGSVLQFHVFTDASLSKQADN